jgi:hypothetical protein
MSLLQLKNNYLIEKVCETYNIFDSILLTIKKVEVCLSKIFSLIFSHK